MIRKTNSNNLVSSLPKNLTLVRKELNRRWRTIKPQHLFVVTFGLFLLSLLTLGLAWNNLRATRNLLQSYSSPTGPSIPINSHVVNGQAEVWIDKVSYSDSQPGFKAPDGKTYAIISLSIKNISTKAINILPTTDTYIKDSSGNVSYTMPYNVENPFHAGELPAGESIKGELSYLLNKNTSAKLYIDAIWSGSVLTFSLE